MTTSEFQMPHQEIPGFPPLPATLPESPQPFRLQFIGTAAVYFKIWIVNLFLSILTLGIYSAWAKVRRERFFATHTLLAGSPFEYHGQPKAILKGRILAVLILVLLEVLPSFLPYQEYLIFLTPLILSLLLPWAIRASLRFQAANTSWRGVHFFFHASIWETVCVFYGWGLLILLTFGLILPAAQRRWHTYLMNNLSFGGERFHSTPGLGRYFFIFLIPFCILLGLAILFTAAGIFLNSSGLPHEDVTILLFIATFLSLYTLAPLLFFAYVKVQLQNHLLNNTHIASHSLASYQTSWGLLKILVPHGLLVLLSCGFYLPAFQVIIRRYRTENTVIYATNLDSFVTNRINDQGAFGEELSDFLDFDFGI